MLTTYGLLTVTLEEYVALTDGVSCIGATDLQFIG